MHGMWIYKGTGQIIENLARMAGHFEFSNVKDSTQDQTLEFLGRERIVISET
jgi:hypothetical protein